MWTTAIVSGITLGSFYTLVALGFALIFGVTHTFNLAHCELLVLEDFWSLLSFYFSRRSPRSSGGLFTVTAIIFQAQRTSGVELHCHELRSGHFVAEWDALFLLRRLSPHSGPRI